MNFSNLPFFKVVQDELSKANNSTGAVESSSGLKPDTIRNILRAESTNGPQLATARDVCDALGLELYIGPPRPKTPTPPVVIDSREYLPVPQYDAHLSAGDGVFNLNAEPIDHLAFSKTWMTQRGLKADQAILVSVRGDSMQPAICDGDLVLIDRQKAEIENGKVYAFNDIGGDSKIKRLELIPGTALALRSDNPDFATVYRKGNDMNFIASGIIGKVVWVGHDLK